MDRVWIRSAAFSCAFACGAMVVGPGVLGTAVAHAILGIGPDLDIFDLFGDDDQKSSLHHPRPGAEDVSGQAARTVGVTTSDAGPPVSTFGSVPESAGPVGISGGLPENVSRGGGGGAVPRSGSAGRSSNLPSVPSAPITRTIVIRGAPPQAHPCRRPCRPRCPRQLASFHWPRRRRARRCPKDGRRLPDRQHPRPFLARNTHGRRVFQATGYRTLSERGMRST